MQRCCTNLVARIERPCLRLWDLRTLALNLNGVGESSFLIIFFAVFLGKWFIDILSVPKISNTKKIPNSSVLLSRANDFHPIGKYPNRCSQFAAKERARLRAFPKKEQLRWQAGHFVSLDYPQFTASTKKSHACGAHVLLFLPRPWLRSYRRWKALRETWTQHWSVHSRDWTSVSIA